MTETLGIPEPELSTLYAAHVARLQADYEGALEETGWGGVVVHSGVPRPRSTFDDQDWPLRPTPHFQHWAPLAVADCAVLVRPGRRPALLRNAARSYWEGQPRPESEHFWSAFDVVDVADPERVKDHLPADVRMAYVGESDARAGAWGLAAEARNPVDLVARLDQVRTRKDAYEVACISVASRRAAAGHRRLIDEFRARSCSELELHLLYLEATGQDDPETPYKNIVAMGPHAAVLHHVLYDRRPPASAAGSLLVDAGASWLGYQADITRTVVKGSTGAAQAFAALVAGVEGLQQEICRRVHVGLPYERLHDQAHELLAPILRDLGIARASDDELVGGGVTRKLLPHGLGHSLGLQTHDVGMRRTPPRPENPYLRNTSIIAAGQVFTIEPGVYFIDALLEELRASPAAAVVDWALVGELRAFGGVRIEDNIAVTEGGPRNLTREWLPD